MRMFPRLALPAVIFFACSGGARDKFHHDPKGAEPPPGSTGERPAAPGSTRDPSGAPSANKSVCATLDYGHDRPNDDYFMTFTDDRAALSYAGDFLSANGLPGASEISKDAKAVGMVSRIYSALRDLYPRETAGLEEPPRLVVVGGRGVNAFTGFDERPEVDQAPWLVFAHREALAHPVEAEITGMLAHELGHLVTRNLLPDTRAKIRTYYRVPGGREDGILGAAATDDPIVRERAGMIREIGQKVGRHVATGPIPMSPYLVTDYEDLLDALKAERGGSPDSGACSTADDGITQMADIARRGASIHEFSALRLTAEETRSLAALGESTAAALKRCYAHVDRSLFELKVRAKAAKGEGTDAESAIRKALDPSTPEHKAARAELMEVERKADTGPDRPTIDRVLGVVEELHQLLDEYEADEALPIDELRVFDMEEDSDDTAVRVLMALGEDPLANARMWIKLMPEPRACTRAVERGEVPPYGRFVDPHNDTCWRYYHTTQFADALAQCPGAKAAGEQSAAKAPAPLSPADPSPMLLVQRRLR